MNLETVATTWNLEQMAWNFSLPRVSALHRLA